MDETNLLSLIKQWLDTNYQITTKNATEAFRKIFQKLTAWILQAGMKTDRIRTDITDIIFVFIFLVGFGFEYE
jgi:hypothetical protein